MHQRNLDVDVGTLGKPFLTETAERNDFGSVEA